MATKPKRPLSAYFLFMQAFKAERGEELAGLSMGETAKRCAAAWKNVTAEEKRAVQAKAEEAKERYTKEMEEYSRWCAENTEVPQQEPEGTSTPFPTSLLARILKRDPDVTKLQKEATLAAGRATVHLQ